MKFRLFCFIYLITISCLGQINKNKNENLYLNSFLTFIDKLKETKVLNESKFFNGLMSKGYILIQENENTVNIAGIDSIRGKNIKRIDIQYYLNSRRYNMIKKITNERNEFALFYFGSPKFIDSGTIRMRVYREIIDIKKKEYNRGGSIEIDYRFDCEKQQFIPTKVNFWDGTVSL